MSTIVEKVFTDYSFEFMRSFKLYFNLAIFLKSCNASKMDHKLFHSDAKLNLAKAGKLNEHSETFILITIITYKFFFDLVEEYGKAISGNNTKPRKINNIY